MCKKLQIELFIGLLVCFCTVCSVLSMPRRQFPQGNLPARPHSDTSALAILHNTHNWGGALWSRMGCGIGLLRERSAKIAHPLVWMKAPSFNLRKCRLEHNPISSSAQERLHRIWRRHVGLAIPAQYYRIVIWDYASECK